MRGLITEREDILSAEYPPENRDGLPLEALFQAHVRFFVDTLDGVPARAVEELAVLQAAAN